MGEARPSPTNDQRVRIACGQSLSDGGAAAVPQGHNGHMKTIARLVAGVLATLFVLVATASVASACSCAGLTLQEQVDSADVVARVIVEKTKVAESEDGGKQVILTMRPTRVWKGEVVSKFPVTTALDIPECGLGDLEEGTDLLLFATELEGKYSAERCGGTTEASEAGAAALVELAGPGKFIEPVVRDEPGAVVWPTITAIAAVVIVAGLVVLWWVVPRRRR